MRFSDAQLLELLEANARESAISMANKLSVTESAIRKRMSKLELEGVIVGYTLKRVSGFDLSKLLEREPV